MTVRGRKRRQATAAEAGAGISQEVIRNLRVTEVGIDRLTPNPRNPKTHSVKQVGQIVASIRDFGFCNPILIDENGRIIAGHGRYKAAGALGLDRVPVIRIAGLTEAQKTALAIADNKIAENAGWDRELLSLEIGSLVETGLDLTLTGFEMGEIDLLLQESDDGADAEADDVVAEPRSADTAVTRPGDLWQIGQHRLLCGDATDQDALDQLLDGETADLCITDPPYNVRIGGNVSGLGQYHHREFMMASGEMSEAEFVAFLKASLGNAARVSREGAIHFVFMDWRHIYPLQTAGREVYSELKNICVWNKTNAGMGSLYRSKHELVAVFKVGTAPHINNVGLGRHGRHRTNVWDHAGVNSFGAGRNEALSTHPTVKPVGLVADAIMDCSNRGDLILDPFAGSGTTILASARTGRRAAAMELDPTYVDTIIRRLQERTGTEAIHSETRMTFSEAAREGAAAVADQKEEAGQ